MNSRSGIGHRTAGRIALVAAALAACALEADASVLCARRAASTGQAAEGAGVKIRDAACRDNEAQIDAAALGVVAPSGLTATIVRTGDTISTNGSLSTPAACQPGEVATGGGAVSQGANGGVPVLRSSRPEPDTAGETPTAWRATVANVAGTGTITATAFVVCATP